MTAGSTQYVVVTPVRDEQDYLPLCIASMVKQSMLPTEWVIVNDGSKDSTRSIIEDATRQYPWIRAVHRQDRGFRKWGGGIIEAFYAGYDALSTKNWEFMCKLDGDLSFEPGYFEGTFRRFAEMPQLGIGGGTLYHFENGKKVIESGPAFHVRGGAKIFRRTCWDVLGGLWVGPGSDTVDEVKANMLGWTTMSFPDLEMQHHRITGASWGRWGGVAKSGTISYVVGYHPVFMLAKAVAALPRPPILLGSIAMLYGYVSAYFKKTPRLNDPELIGYLRQQQISRLIGSETIWK